MRMGMGAYAQVHIRGGIVVGSAFTVGSIIDIQVV